MGVPQTVIVFPLIALMQDRSAMCHVQYQRDSFGEAVAEPCGSGDNCASGLAMRASRVAALPDRAAAAVEEEAFA
jgi:superfamily II DNA helicase RecQ